MKAVMIGAGNAAFHIGPALQACGVEWVQVYSRTLAHAREIGERTGCVSCTHRPEEIDREADLYLLAVRDEAISGLTSVLRLPGKIVLHVAGSVPLSVLAPVSEHYGVMYFFQTFSKQAPAPDFRSVPVCLEASDPYTAGVLEKMARRLSERVCFLSSAQRGILHLGGVFACNYTNLMYTAAYDLLKERDVDFSLLLPLIGQTALKVARISPDRAQTGPAVRGDEEVMEKHLALLSESPQGRQYVELYRSLAKAVQDRHKRKSVPDR